MRPRARPGIRVLGVLLLAALPASAARAADEEVRTIPARPGVTESFLLLRSPSPPWPA